jgi:signal transduction histidine kinase
MNLQYIIIISIWIISLVIYFYTLSKSKSQSTAKLISKNKELQKIYSNLRKLYEKEKDLMDMAGHEIRTPATVIKNNLYLLEKHLQKNNGKSLDAKTKKYLDRLISSTDRQITIINSFLETTRIDGKTFTLQKSEKDITDIVKRSVEDIKSEVENKGLKITLSQTKENITTLLDYVRIREVIDNLLQNALKYTSKGKIEVETKVENNCFVFKVKDTGIGIEEKDLKNLFKKFSRINSNIGKDDNSLIKPGGTGLGLYVSKHIIAEHNGKIGATSKKGEGSTFFFKIPLQ